MKLTKYFVLLAAGSLLSACSEDYFDETDSGSLTSDQVGEVANEDPDKVYGPTLSGCYTTCNFSAGFSSSGINSHMNRGLGGIMLLSDVMGNDVSLSLGSGDPWRYDHALDYNAMEYVRPNWPWTIFYTIIKGANDLINQVEDAGLDINDPESLANADEKTRSYLGQALAFRGFSHFILAQFYQKTYAGHEDKMCVPLLLSKQENTISGRALVKEVYASIESDFLKAIDLLGSYQRPDKTTINRNVAQGMLSRVYLVMNKWNEAAEMAHAARQGYPVNSIQQAAAWNYQDITNQEVLWGLVPTASTTMMYASWASWRCIDGPGYASPDVGCVQLMDAKLYSNITPNDVRKTLFVDPTDEDAEYPAYANVKFDFVDQWLGNVVYMRSSELVLTEAEALFNAGRVQEAGNVLGELLNNRIEGWTVPSPLTVNYIRTQRRLELWGEGFTYFDHLRWGMDLDRAYDGTNEGQGLNTLKIPASSYKWIYQIPKTEILNNEAIDDEDNNPLS